MPQAESDGYRDAQGVVGACTGRASTALIGNAQLLQGGGREEVLGTAGTAGLRKEPQLVCLGQLSPSGEVVGLELLHWALMEKLASISPTGRRKRKISVPEKRKELSGKCVCFIRWCLTAFKIFFYSQ